jgi:hypothetical protein
MAAGDDDLIDWSLTTWDGARREQFRRWGALPLENVIRALEEMQRLAEQLVRDGESSTASRHVP